MQALAPKINQFRVLTLLLGSQSIAAMCCLEETAKETVCDAIRRYDQMMYMYTLLDAGMNAVVCVWARNSLPA